MYLLGKRIYRYGEHIMFNRIKITSIKLLLLSLLLAPTVNAAPLQEECDNKKKTCCLAQKMSNIPPLWVNADSCPKGMADDTSCSLQYGCTAIKEPASNAE
jgi:hypothetical protein